jgi:hypothetical protein
MNKSQKREVKKISEKIDRSFANRYKSRGGRPTIVHEKDEKNEKIAIPAGNKVDLDDYIDYV